MPDTLHPPFVSTATSQPRQLIRWLDINPQGGPLNRIQTFITLPVFSQVVTWRGYSEIVAAFNFEGPNNFSFTSFSGEFPSNPNYLLCVMWEDAAFNAHRYSLWRNVGEIIYFPLLPYTGQLIKKNFRLEIWSTNNTPAVNNTAFNLYTTVRGILDYRYGSDSALVTNDALFNSFQNIESGVIDPLPVNPSFKYRWNTFSGLIPSGIGSFISWTDSISGKVLLPTGLMSLVNTTGLTNPVRALKDLSGNDAAVDITADAVKLNCIVVATKFTTQDTTLFFDTNNDNLLLFNHVPGTITLSQQGVIVATVAGIQTGVWYVVIASVNTVWVYTMLTGVLFGKNTTGAAAISNATTIGSGTSSFNIIEIILGTAIPTNVDTQNIVNYFTDEYFSAFTLPLKFLAGATPQPN